MAGEKPSPLAAVLADAPSAAVDVAAGAPDKEQQLARWDADLKQLQDAVRKWMNSYNYQTDAIALFCRDNGLQLGEEEPKVIINGLNKDGATDKTAMEGLKALFDEQAGGLNLDIATEVSFIGDVDRPIRERLYSLVVAPKWVIELREARRLAKEQENKSAVGGVVRQALEGDRNAASAAPAEAESQNAEQKLIAAVASATTFAELKTAIEEAHAAGMDLHPADRVDAFAETGDESKLTRRFGIRPKGVQLLQQQRQGGSNAAPEGRNLSPEEQFLANLDLAHDAHEIRWAIAQAQKAGVVLVGDPRMEMIARNDALEPAFYNDQRVRDAVLRVAMQQNGSSK